MKWRAATTIICALSFLLFAAICVLRVRGYLLGADYFVRPGPPWSVQIISSAGSIQIWCSRGGIGGRAGARTIPGFRHDFSYYTFGGAGGTKFGFQYLRFGRPPQGGLVILPDWFLALCFLTPTLVQALVLWSARRRRLRVASGRCSVCGYDLRATPTRCPECGTVAEE